MTDAEAAEFLAAIKKLRDQLDVLRVYVTPLLSAASKTEMAQIVIANAFILVFFSPFSVSA
jgi:hypothetical protein